MFAFAVAGKIAKTKSLQERQSNLGSGACFRNCSARQSDDSDYVYLSDGSTLKSRSNEAFAGRRAALQTDRTCDASCDPEYKTPSLTSTMQWSFAGPISALRLR